MTGPGPDGPAHLYEVKRRGKNFTTIYKALAQAREYGGYTVAFRDDRQEWLVAVPLTEWKKFAKMSADFEEGNGAGSSAGSSGAPA